MYYLGIDGGGTKTKFILCDEKGKILTSVEESTCHYLQVGLNGLTNVLKQGLENICKKANINKEEIVSAYAGMPGYGDIKGDMNKIQSAVIEALSNISFSIGNDGENALAGALACKDGINIVAGTGSIGFGHNSKTNTTIKCGGWHHGLGSDEGSAFWIAQRLLCEFTRQSDGRDEKTKLYEKVRHHLNLDDDGEIINIVVTEWNIDRTKVAGLSKLIDELFDENDPYAIKIINAAAKELSEIIIALYNNLGFTNQVIVSYTGGVFNMGNKIINALGNNLPKDKMILKEPTLGPDKGSLLLALQNGNVEITDEIVNNLK